MRMQQGSSASTKNTSAESHHGDWRALSTIERPESIAALQHSRGKAPLMTEWRLQATVLCCNHAAPLQPTSVLASLLGDARALVLARTSALCSAH